MSGPLGLLHPMTVVLFCMGSLLCCASCSHKQSDLSSFRAPRFTRFLYIFTLLAGVRYGEAVHPGPRSRVTSKAFCIGTFNPSGLAGISQVINQYLQHGDIWSVAETHTCLQNQFHLFVGAFESRNRHTGTWLLVILFLYVPTLKHLVDGKELRPCPDIRPEHCQSRGTQTSVHPAECW